MKTTTLTDAKMAAYWTTRVAELEAMRPITADEAIAQAAELEAQAEALDDSVAAAEQAPRESGRVAIGDSVQARDSRNARVLGDARRAVWGNTARALQCRGRAKSLRSIAEQPIGTALAESLADARAKRDYYSRLAAK